MTGSRPREKPIKGQLSCQTDLRACELIGGGGNRTPVPKYFSPRFYVCSRSISVLSQRRPADRSSLARTRLFLTLRPPGVSRTASPLIVVARRRRRLTDDICLVCARQPNDSYRWHLKSVPGVLRGRLTTSTRNPDLNLPGRYHSPPVVKDQRPSHHANPPTSRSAQQPQAPPHSIDKSAAAHGIYDSLHRWVRPVAPHAAQFSVAGSLPKRDCPVKLGATPNSA